jgi:hypothetical protein
MQACSVRSCGVRGCRHLGSRKALPASTNLRTLAATIKARWVCEQADQQLRKLASITSKADPGKASAVMRS